MIATAQQQLWIHDDGRISCRDHVGHYAACALERSPDARLIQTPLGTWQKLTLADRAQLVELGCTPKCEVCDAQVRSRQQIRRVK